MMTTKSRYDPGTATNKLYRALPIRIDRLVRPRIGSIYELTCYKLVFTGI